VCESLSIEGENKIIFFVSSSSSLFENAGKIFWFSLIAEKMVYLGVLILE